MNAPMMRAHLMIVLNQGTVAASLALPHAVMVPSMTKWILDAKIVETLILHWMTAEGRIAATPKDMTINPVVVNRPF